MLWNIFTYVLGEVSNYYRFINEGQEYPIKSLSFFKSDYYYQYIARGGDR